MIRAVSGVEREGSVQPIGLAPEGVPTQKPGLIEYLKLAWDGFTQDVSHPDQKDLKARMVRMLAGLRARWQGFSPEQCERILVEIGDKLSEDRLLQRERDMDGYLVYSKTFREHPFGRDYLRREQVPLSDRDLQQLAVADRLRGELLGRLPSWPSKETVTVLYNDIKQDYSVMDRFLDSQFSDVSKSHAYGYLLGLTPSEAKQLAKEVFHASAKWKIAESVSFGFSKCYGTAFIRLVQSPTLQACAAGRDLITLAKANVEADRLVMRASGEQLDAPLGSSVLERAENRYANEESNAQSVELTENRGIGDGRSEGTLGKGSDQQLLMVLHRQGFQGLRDYIGNDTQRYNQFVAVHQLMDLAIEEDRIRQQGGDWLYATQMALKDRLALGLPAERMATNAPRLVAH